MATQTLREKRSHAADASAPPVSRVDEREDPQNHGHAGVESGQPIDESQGSNHGSSPSKRAEERAPKRRRRSPRQWLRHCILRLEARMSRLAGRNAFWHKVLAWRFLPMAFRSGIKFDRGNVGTFSAVLPFRRFNRNWYNAMAGAALLGNAEIVGGMYVFKHCGDDYTVVCKELTYKFMRPCVGPAVYHCEPRDDLEALVQAGGEFNITVDLEVKQMVTTKNEHERRVGRATAKFHVTPKTMWRDRKKRQEARLHANTP